MQMAGIAGAYRQSNSQAVSPTRAGKRQQQQQQHLSSATGSRTPPPVPMARGGDSYVNETARLVVSDPLPYSARQRQSGGGAEGAPNTVRRELLATGPSPPTGEPTQNGGSAGRSRAASLPRTPEDLKDVLPRLRPMREETHGSIAAAPNANSAAAAPPPAPPPPPGLRSLATAGHMYESDDNAHPLHPSTSAPIIPSSHSPRPIGDQLRLRGRHNKHHIRGDVDIRGVRLDGSGGTHESILSSSGSDDGEANTAGTGAAATRRNPKGSAAAAVAAAVAVRQGPPDAGKGNHAGVDGAGADDVFGSTQLLSSLRPAGAGGGGAPNGVGNGASAGVRPTPPTAPLGVPSARSRHHVGSSGSGNGAAAAAAGGGAMPATCASENELPPYKFNVVLSSGKTATVPITLISGSGCVQGMRPTMEDAHFAELNAAQVRGQPVSLLAVLDGHCGRRVADLGAKWLPHYVLQHAALGENNALALVESILQTDREVFHTLQAKKNQLQQRKGVRGSGGTGRRRRDVEEEMFDDADSGANGGSTLIAAAVYGRMLYVACLGDARAVLYDGQTTIAMSEDHKPGNSDESRRIAKCGGFVQFGRVCGILAVSRALGDFEFKFQPTSAMDAKGDEKLSTDFPFGAMRDGGGVSSSTDTNTTSSSHNRRFISNRDLMVSNIADVRQLHLTDASSFLLLACDGLWDVLSNEEATEFVRDFLCYTPDVCDPHILTGAKPRPSADVVRRVLNNCCQKLAEFAVDRGSMDNVSVMVLFFHDVVETVARFSGRLASSATTGVGNDRSSNASASRSRSLRSSSNNAHPRNSAPPAFELTNNQLTVRNGRIVAQR